MRIWVIRDKGGKLGPRFNWNEISSVKVKRPQMRVLGTKKLEMNSIVSFHRVALRPKISPGNPTFGTSTRRPWIMFKNQQEPINKHDIPIGDQIELYSEAWSNQSQGQVK